MASINIVVYQGQSFPETREVLVQGVSSYRCVLRGAGLAMVLIMSALSFCPPLGLGSAILSSAAAIGGISIKPSGLLERASLEQLDEVSKKRAEAMQKLPADIKGAVSLRKAIRSAVWTPPWPRR